MSIFGKGTIKIREDALSVAEMAALSSVGYFVGRNNKEHIDDILEWYSVLQLAGDSDFEKMFDEGLHKLVDMISDNPFIQLQLMNVLKLIEIDVDNPLEGFDLGRYQNIVNNFMAGITAASMEV